MENNDLKVKVLKRLEEKIAMDNFIDSEKVERKENKSYSKLGIKVASIAMVASLVGGNIYTFATYNENLFSYTLKKIGIFQEYDENKQVVDISSKYNDVELKVTDYAIDSNNLIVGYKLILNESNENLEIKFVENTKLISNADIYTVSEGEREFRGISKLSNTEYEIYRIYDIDASQLKDNDINFVNDITIYNGEELSENLVGTWNFEFKINNENVNAEYEEYDVIDKKIVLNNKNSEFFDILAIEKSKLATRILFAPGDIYMCMDMLETGHEYTIEILDENGNIILNDNQEYVFDSTVSVADVIIGNNVLTSKIMIIVYEKDKNGQIISNGYVELDLENNLKLREKNQSRIENEEFKDIKLQVDLSLANIDAINDNFSIQLQKEYKNKNYNTGYVDISSYSYPFTMTDIMEIADDYIKLFGVFVGEDVRFLDKYTITRLSDDNNFESYTFTHEEIMKMMNGETIQKDGNRFSKDSLMIEEVTHNEVKKVLINGIECATWVQQNIIAGTEKYYIFLLNGNLYQIRCSLSFEANEQVKDIINSINIK